MTAQLIAPCPRCGGPTISKGQHQRMCKPCNYRFQWPPVMCKVCGAPKSSGQGRRLSYCEAHYPTEIERHRSDYQRQPSTTRKPPVTERVAPVTKSGKAVNYHGNTYAIEGGLLVINGVAKFEPTDIEAAFWNALQGVK